MAHNGNGGVLQVSADNVTFNAVGEITTWSIELSGEAIEVTSMGTHNYKQFIPGNYGWTGSAEAFWADDNTAQESVETALTGGDSTFYGKFYPIGSSAGDYWSGVIIITGVSFTGGINSAVGFSFSFQGHGALTHNNA